jgi:Fe-S-cluster-containing dehydrogenase component
MPDQGSSSSTVSSQAIYIDLKRCIGCNACSVACKQENNVSIGERWNEVYGAESTSSTLDIRVMPMYCQHCNDAPCKKKCDSLGYRAIIQRADGIVYIDAAKCVGCQKCLPYCKYKALSFNTQTKKMEKCHLCMQRIDQGLAPACVITCIGITREFGSFDALKARHPDAEQMGDRVRMLYGHLGEEPKEDHDRPTSSYPDASPCHD